MSENLLKTYNVNNELIEEIENIAKEKKLTPAKKEKLIKRVAEEYKKGAFEPGEAFGIIAAQSISEPATQMTMRTYHFVGTAGIQVTLGLPRLVEIFDAKREPSNVVMTLLLEKEYNTEKGAKEVAELITEKCLKNYIETISLDLTDKKIKIKLRKCTSKTEEMIFELITKKFKTQKVKQLKESISVTLKPDSTVRDLQKIKKKILELHVEGIPTVKDLIIVKQGNDWVIKASGVNFKEIMKFNQIDKMRSYTNNIYEMLDVFGIEAARSIMIKEIKDTLKQQGLDIDDRYTKLVTDMMTFTGEIQAIGRYGVAGKKSSVLVRAGFEETVQHLVKSSVANETDHFNSLFNNVMVNQQIPAGTGMFDLVSRMDE